MNIKKEVDQLEWKIDDNFDFKSEEKDYGLDLIMYLGAK